MYQINLVVPEIVLPLCFLNKQTTMKQAKMLKTKQYRFGISLAKDTLVWIKQDGSRYLAATSKDATIWLGVFKKDFELIPEKQIGIMLPVEICSKYANSSPLAYNAISNYATEVALIAIIISDNIMKPFYDKSQIGYMACIDQIQVWAKEFVTKYAHVEEWEEFCSTQTIYKNIMCWDDFVIAYANELLENYDK